MKRSPIRPRSKKTEAKYRQRRKLVAEMLERYPWCARCLWNRSVDLHELKNRSQGGDILDPEQIVTVCRDCHRWITENPAAAHAGGWTYWSHEDVDKPCQEASVTDPPPLVCLSCGSIFIERGRCLDCGRVQ